MGRRRGRLGLLLCLLGGATPVIPPALAAQVAPLGVPRGVLRVELFSAIGSADERYRDGTREDFGAAFTNAALGTAAIPSLVAAEARFAALIGDPAYRFNLGASNGAAQTSENVGGLGLGVGVTRWLTLFGRVPIVRTRVQARLTLDSTASNVGFNVGHPTIGTGDGQAAAAGFFAQLAGARTTLASRIASGTYDGDPAQRALADATLADLQALDTELFALLSSPTTASAVAPTATSTAGAALVTRISTLQSTLNSNLGVSGFAAPAPLPSQRLGVDQLAAFVTDANGAVRADLEGQTLMGVGDAEVGVVITPIDRWDREGRPGGVRVAVAGSVRLPTGQIDDPNALFDGGTGTGHTALTGEIAADLGLGAFGLRLGGAYQRFLATEIERRVAPPSVMFPPADRLARVRVRPGGVVRLSATPFVRLAPAFMLHAGIQHLRRATNQVSYAAGATPIAGVDAAVLAEGSRANATAWSVGVTYAPRAGARGLPVDATWLLEQVMASSEGQVARTRTVRVQLRLYQRLFGN